LYASSQSVKEVKTFHDAKTSGSTAGVVCTQHLHVVASSIAKLPDDAFILAAMAGACSMGNLVRLLMKLHLLALP